jgi:hypothetical protein
MVEHVITLAVARNRLEELMPEIYRTLNNWSLEPSWERAASDWTAVMSEFVNREGIYWGLLEETVLQFEERIAALEKRVAGRVPVG